MVIVMMKQLILVLCLVLAAPPALADADAIRDRIVAELQSDGFTQIRMNRTWLGRLRFVGDKPGARREIVVNPATGVILRDYLQLLLGNGNGGGSGPGASTGGGGATLSSARYLSIHKSARSPMGAASSAFGSGPAQGPDPRQDCRGSGRRLRR